jgi:hemerythrin-like domain-containing protein
MTTTAAPTATPTPAAVPEAEPAGPDTTTYYLVHRAMLASSAQLAAALVGLARGDRRRARAIVGWYRGFTGELLAHHTIEDELLFPSLASQVPEVWAAYEADLAADHEHLDHVMAGLDAALDALADGTPEWTAVHRRAVVLARELRDHLADHLQVEDDEVIPLFERHYTAEEYEALDQAAVKHMKLRQLWFTLPWMVAACTPEERGRLLAGAPTPLTWLWKAARASYARRASYALGTTVPRRPPVA